MHFAYQLWCADISCDRPDQQMFGFALKFRCHMWPNTACIQSTELCDKLRPLHRHRSHWPHSVPNYRRHHLHRLGLYVASQEWNSICFAYERAGENLLAFGNVGNAHLFVHQLSIACHRFGQWFIHIFSASHTDPFAAAHWTRGPFIVFGDRAFSCRSVGKD